MKKLNADDLIKLNSQFEQQTFNNDFDFVYEQQIPNVAVLLTSGEIKLYKKNKLLEIVDPGHLLGAYQLLHNEPVKYSCKIGKKSTVILLDKSTLMEACKYPCSPLSEIIKEMDK